MANIPLVISSVKQLEYYKGLIKETSDKTIDNIRDILSTKGSIESLFELKFHQVGYEPVQGYKLNLIEQLNQMFSHIVVFKAVEYLLSIYADQTFTLNIGTTGGYDIVSLDEKIICECFATTSPISNDKIKKDAEKLEKNTTAEKKYIVFYSYEANETTLANLRGKHPNITFIILENIEL